MDNKQLKDLGRHQLHQLWPNFKPILQTVCQQYRHEIPRADIEGIDSYVEQLADVDPDAQAFRYALDKKGYPSLPSGLKHINVAVFAEHMERLADYLFGMDAFFQGICDFKNEMTAEYSGQDEGAG